MAYEHSVTRPTTKILYSDFDITFAKHPATRDLARLTNRQAVTQSVRNLILCAHWERPFRSSIGTSIRKLLFENISPIIAAQLRSQVKFAIDNHEPRARYIDCQVVADPDNNGYNVTVTFAINNEPATTTISIFLERVR